MKKVMLLPKVGASRMFLLLAILIIGELRTYAQLRMGNEPSRPSADSWEMVKYGEIEPSLYTGTINLHIPFYTYKDNDFEIPISFNYASNGCIPNSRPGVLGPGWILEAGGVIIREIRGIPDNVDENSIAVGFWYPFSLPDAPTSRCYSETQYPVFYLSSEQPNTFTIQNEGTYHPFHNGVMYTTGSANGSAPDEDAEPDVFHFNFMGYSGCFRLDYNHSIVIYDTNFNSKEMKVEINLNTSNTVRTLFFSDAAPTVAESDRFASIIFTDSKGYRYVFNGATTNNGNDPENDCSNLDIIYDTPTNYETIYAPADIIAWHLSKIVAPNGRTVSFNYGRSSPLKCVRPATFRQNESCHSQNGNTIFNHDLLTDWYYSVSENALLQSIIIDNGGSIVFSYGEDYYDSFSSGTEPAIRLESAAIKYASDTVKSVILSYENAKNNSDPFLSTMHISGEGEYSFRYYNLNTYPSIGEKKLDHWGYFNNRSELPIPTPPTDPDDTTYSVEYADFIREQNSQVKESLYYYGTVGLLSRIYYPTGGYSRFDYEGNTYSKAIVRDDTSDYVPVLKDSTNSFGCGGVRISRIRNYDADNTVQFERSFSYSLTNGKSSGLLTYIPLNEYVYECEGASIIFVIAGSNMGYFIPYGQVLGRVEGNNLTKYNSTHIEYSHVIETRGDGSKIEYTFSTSATPGLLDTLVIGNAWMDPGFSMPQASLRNACRSVAEAMSKQCLRGRLISKKYYNETGQLLQEDINEYGDLRPSYISDYCRSVRTCMERTTFTGDDKLVATGKNTYSNDGLFNESTDYTFNSAGMLESSSSTDSKGKTRTEVFSYVSASSLDPIEKAMYDNHVTRYPMLVQEYYDGVLIKETATSFCRPDVIKSRLFRPLSVTETDCLSGDSLTTNYQYDKKGNIIGIRHPDGTESCVIWGFGGLYPVALIEGCLPESITSIPGFESIADAPLESGLGALESSLRVHLPATAEASTFQYLPLVGLVKETSPDGRHTDYVYNNSGKLKSILDNAGARLKYFFYSPDNKQSVL